MKKSLYVIFTLVLVFSCSSDSTNSSVTANELSTGQGGSLARFTIKDNYLYTVDTYNLNVFNINDNEQPVQVNTIQIGFDIETLFNLKDYLYMGSRNGMYIYSIENRESPSYLSSVQHFTACDPVVANVDYAFVTLHSNTICGNNINLLEVYNITDIVNPVLISSRNLIAPKGLGLFNNYLFVSDDEVKIFDMTNPEESNLIGSIDVEAFDVIIHNELLVLIGENGLHQFSLDSNDINNITELSSIIF